MKAIDKLLDLLPVPLLLAVASAVFLAWLFKELTHRDYGEVFRDQYFQGIFVVVFACTAVYYALFLIFSQSKPFAPNDRGVLIAKFSSDLADTARIHTIETLKTQLGNSSEFDDVKIRPLAKVINIEDGETAVKEQNAVGLITAEYVPLQNPIVHYQLFWNGSGKIARFTADKFPDIRNFVEQFVTQMRSIPTARNLPATTLNDLQAQIAALKAENERLVQSLRAARGSNAKFPGAEKPKLYVLSIGISNYSDPSFRLQYAAADAQRFASAVSKSSGFADIVTKVLINENGTRRNVVEQVHEIFNSATENDYFYLYFSGHSMQVGRDWYLLPNDAVASSAAGTGIDLGDIGRAAAQGRQKFTLFFLDTLLSAPLETQLRLVPSALDVTTTGTTVGAIAATAPGQPAFEDEHLGGSVFTHYLVNGILGAAANADGVIKFAQLVDYLADNVGRATGGASTPSIFLHANGGFSGNPVVAIAGSGR